MMRLIEEIEIDAKGNPVGISVKGLLNDIALSTQHQKI